MTNIKVHYLVNFKTRTGEILNTFSSQGKALMKLWAYNNTKVGTDTFIFEADTGNIVFHASGKKNDMPDIINTNINIETLCPGLLAVLQEGEHDTKRAD